MDDMNKESALNTLLQRHIQQVTELSTLLQQEYQALRAGHAGEIEAISSEKSIVLNGLKSLEQEQQQLLSSILAEEEKPSVTMAIAPQDPLVLTVLNEKLTQLAQQCHKQNQINGMVINMGQQFTDKALAILHGQNPAAVNQLVYGRNGQTEAKIEHHNLTKA